MPIYEYKCADCGAHFEKLQKTSDEPLKVCEKCSGKLEKQWSLSGFQFKGEGWYVTDYAKKKSSDSAGAESKTKSETSKKSDGDSTESKDSASKKTPETKPEPKKESKPASD